MEGVKFSVHPLFYLFGLYYAFTGRIFLFLIYTFSAVIHELGHSFCAHKCGYRLNKIILMPFGAVVKGDIKGLKPIDEIKIALSGPVINLELGVVFVALWWVFPETYAYTDVLAGANFSLGLINLLPAYPLDGGRVVYSLLAKKFSHFTAKTVCRVLGILLGAITMGLFVFSIYSGINLSLLFFSLFIFFGVFMKEDGCKYVKIHAVFSLDKLKKGIEIKRQALSVEADVKKLLEIIEENKLNEIEVYNKNALVAVLSQNKINYIIENYGVYAKLYEIL